MDSTRTALVVVQKDDHSLGIYDYEDGHERARVALPPFPHEFAVDIAGRYSYQCHFGVRVAEDEGPGGDEVSVVDLARGEYVRSIHCAPWRRPHGIAFDRRGVLYVLSEDANRLLVVPDPHAGGVERDLPTGGRGSHIVTVDGAGRRAWCSNMGSATVTVVDLANGAEPRAIPVGERPEGSAFDRDERRLVVTNRESASLSVIDTASARVISTVATPPGPVRIAHRPDGRFAVACYHDRSMVVVDIDRERVDARVALPLPPVSIALDPSGDRVLAGLLPTGIAVVDFAAGAVLRTIATRPGPDPMAIVALPS